MTGTILAALLLGCGSGAPTPEPTVPLQIPCDPGSCTVADAVVPEGARVQVTRRLDLLDGAGRWPAALVEVVDAEGPRTATSLVLVSLREDPPKKLLWLDLQRREADGGGLSTLGDGPRLVRTHADQPLTVQLEQTSLPGDGEAPYRPGPPIREEWRWNGERYAPHEGWSAELGAP